MTEKKSVKAEFMEGWLDFKKQCNWNNFKGLISGVLPLVGFMYLFSGWMKLVSPLMDQYIKSHNGIDTMSQHDAVLALCVLIGFIGPLFFAFPILSAGFWLGRVTKFYKDNKTIYLEFDTIHYYLRDLSEEQRDRIKEILTPYKSKLQLRKESRAHLSWFRRTFT